jgi:hypothetical protein
VPGDTIEIHNLDDGAVALDHNVGGRLCLRITKPRDRTALGEPARRVMQHDECSLQAAALIRRRDEGRRLSNDHQPIVDDLEHANRPLPAAC